MVHLAAAPSWQSMCKTEKKCLAERGRVQQLTEAPGCIILADFLCCWGPSAKEMGLGGLLGLTLGSNSAQSDRALLSCATIPHSLHIRCDELCSIMQLLHMSTTQRKGEGDVCCGKFVSPSGTTSGCDVISLCTDFTCLISCGCVLVQIREVLQSGAGDGDIQTSNITTNC